MALLRRRFSEANRRSHDIRVATRVAKAAEWFSKVNKGSSSTHYSKTRAAKPLEKWIKREIAQRTPRKFAVQTPANIAHRSERDISNGPGFLSLPASSGFCRPTRCCEGVARSGSLSEDMLVSE